MARLVEITEDNEEPPSYLQATDAKDAPHQSSNLSTSETKKGHLVDSDDDEEHEHEHDAKSTGQELIKYDDQASASSTTDQESSSSPEIHDPDKSTTSSRKHHHFGQRIKNKLTGTTHAEREEERARQAALYRKAYESTPAGGYYGGYGPGYGYGYGGGYGYGLGAAYGSSLLFDAALLGGLGGFGFGGLWF